MKAEYANIFIRSAVDVFQKEANIKMSRKDLSRKDSPVPSLPVSIIIGVTGFIRGQVVYAMDQSFTYEVAHAMLPNRLPAEIRKLSNSAVSEIANIITGQASIALAGENEKIHITPPAVLMASDLTMDFLEIPTISLSLISEIGVLEINIALTEEGGR
ncbi:MAG: chemotaxis protein CheX [Rectinemataceae bacterium]